MRIRSHGEYLRSAGMVLLAALAAAPATAAAVQPRPPICPRWALLPWVWDDRGSDNDFRTDDNMALGEWPALGEAARFNHTLQNTRFTYM